MKHILLPLALILLLVLAACESDDRDSEPSAPIDDTPRAAACEPAPGAEIVTGWRFQTDPDDAGLDEGWHPPSTIPAGARWSRARPGRTASTRTWPGTTAQAGTGPRSLCRIGTRPTC